MLLSTIMMLSVFSFQVSAEDTYTQDESAVWAKEGTLGGKIIAARAGGWNTTGSALSNTSATSPQALTVNLGEQSSSNGSTIDGPFMLSLVTSGARLTTTGAAIKKTGDGKTTTPAENDYGTTAISLNRGTDNVTYTANIENIADGGILVCKNEKRNCRALLRDHC